MTPVQRAEENPKQDMILKVRRQKQSGCEMEEVGKEIAEESGKLFSWEALSISWMEAIFQFFPPITQLIYFIAQKQQVATKISK